MYLASVKAPARISSKFKVFPTQEKLGRKKGKQTKTKEGNKEEEEEDEEEEDWVDLMAFV